MYETDWEQGKSWHLCQASFTPYQIRSVSSVAALTLVALLAPMMRLYQEILGSVVVVLSKIASTYIVTIFWIDFIYSMLLINKSWLAFLLISYLILVFRLIILLKSLIFFTSNVCIYYFKLLFIDIKSITAFYINKQQGMYFIVI